MRLAYVLPIVLAGCKCLPVPTSDVTPPTASVMVEYRQPGGQRVTRTMAVGTADATVLADKNDVVAVVYSGSDNQGLRSVELVYDAEYRSGNTVVQPLLRQLKLTAGCPRELLLDSENFGPDQSPWRYEFSGRAENWLGMTSTSGKVIVQTQ